MRDKTVHLISDQKLTLDDLNQINKGKMSIQLSEDAQKKIIRCREYLDTKIKNSNQPIYGINTGFGSLYNKHIAADHLEKLQENLVKSHACGTGPQVDHAIVKWMLFLKVQSL